MHSVWRHGRRRGSVKSARQIGHSSKLSSVFDALEAMMILVQRETARQSSYVGYHCTIKVNNAVFDNYSSHNYYNYAADYRRGR